MRTSLNIDDAMLFEVIKVTGKENRSEAIRIALATFLKQQKKHNTRHPYANSRYQKCGPSANRSTRPPNMGRVSV